MKQCNVKRQEDDHDGDDDREAGNMINMFAHLQLEAYKMPLTTTHVAVINTARKLVHPKLLLL